MLALLLFSSCQRATYVVGRVSKCHQKVPEPCEVFNQPLTPPTGSNTPPKSPSRRQRSSITLPKGTEQCQRAPHAATGPFLASKGPVTPERLTFSNERARARVSLLHPLCEPFTVSVRSFSSSLQSTHLPSQRCIPAKARGRELRDLRVLEHPLRMQVYPLTAKSTQIKGKTK